VNGSVVRDSNGAARIFEGKEHAGAGSDLAQQVVDLGVDDIRSILGRGPGRPGGLFV
jgi:hypothetical protein